MKRIATILGIGALVLGLASGLLTFLEACSLISSSIWWVYAYAFALAVVFGGTIVLAFLSPMRFDSGNVSAIRIFRSAPVWVQTVSLLGLISMALFLFASVGGSIQILDWQAARPIERAAIFSGFGLFAFLSLPAAFACREQQDAARGPAS